MTSPTHVAELSDLKLEKPAHAGAVLAHHDGKAVMVYYGLPEERVRGQIYQRRRGVAFARAAEVLTASPERVQAPCPHFGECGGCHWQHAAYPYQLQLKRIAVADLWARAGLRLPSDTNVVGMEDPWRYRIRGEFEAVYSDTGLRFGFHRLRSHSLLPIDTCPIHDLRIEEALDVFADTARELGVSNLHTLRLTVEPTGKGLLWAARLNGRGGLNPEFAGLVSQGLREVVLLDDSLSLDFWGLSFRVRNDTFVQPNYRQMLELYTIVLELLAAKSGESILDLYSGIGTISLPVARAAKQVIGIDSNRGAVSLAGLAARINSFGNARFIAATVEGALAQVRLGEHDAAVLDPPRAGCEPAAVAQLIRLGLSRLVYVSCEPSTQVRDLVALVRGGYRIRRVVLVDMFPQTYHVESVALLER